MSDTLIPRSAMDRLPIFPLKNLVLFPGAVLPLHIFEERYKELAEDVLAGNKLIGVPRLISGEEVGDEKPPVRDVFGVGCVIGSRKLDDGGYNMVLRGVARARLDYEHPPRRLYREVQAHVMTEEPSARGAELPVLEAQLVALVDRLTIHVDGDRDKLRQLARSRREPSEKVDILSAALVTHADLRQTLLETTDPADRFDLVIEHLGDLIAHMGRATGDLN